MKTISILGTSSNSGKSWVSTALCAWLKQQGLHVAPFKGQNMSNNAYATLEGGEIGIAQAVQAEACGLRPIAEMNPILLKPSGESRSQLVRMGKAVDHIAAKNYYQTLDESWKLVTRTLDEYWPQHCDILVMEGAGSPVELNLMDRDIANLTPCRHTKGKWILVGDIECGGIFSQIIGTWNLLPPKDQHNGLGFIVNKFRGDPELFANATPHFAKHTPLPHLGTLPFDPSLYIDDEDSLVTANNLNDPIPPAAPFIAWIRFPRLSNSQDQLPWVNDKGIQNYWTESPKDLSNASAIILPGSKNTLADLHWLKHTGLASIIQQKAASGTPIVGICGGYQMLGQTISDPDGKAGTVSPSVEGLKLLPVQTTYREEKTVTRTQAIFGQETWDTYEIHMGDTTPTISDHTPLLRIKATHSHTYPDGILYNNIWGTYQHGLFDHFSQRQSLIDQIGLNNVSIAKDSWQKQRTQIYQRMGDLLETHLDMNPIKRYLNI